jgi:hypothetical protein
MLIVFGPIWFVVLMLVIWYLSPEHLKIIASSILTLVGIFIVFMSVMFVLDVLFFKESRDLEKQQQEMVNDAKLNAERKASNAQ